MSVKCPITAFVKAVTALHLNEPQLEMRGHVVHALTAFLADKTPASLVAAQDVARENALFENLAPPEMRKLNEKLQKLRNHLRFIAAEEVLYNDARRQPNPLPWRSRTALAPRRTERFYRDNQPDLQVRLVLTDSRGDEVETWELPSSTADDDCNVYGIVAHPAIVSMRFTPSVATDSFIGALFATELDGATRLSTYLRNAATEYLSLGFDDADRGSDLYKRLTDSEMAFLYDLYRKDILADIRRRKVVDLTQCSLSIELFCGIDTCNFCTTTLSDRRWLACTGLDGVGNIYISSWSKKRSQTLCCNTQHNIHCDAPYWHSMAFGSPLPKYCWRLADM